LHNGTILVDTDTEKMMRYLTVSPDKMKSKGVDSVKSRVVNLSELNPSVTTELLEEKLSESFEEVYGIEAERVDEKEFDLDEIGKIQKERFQNDTWRFGANPVFENVLEKRFDWGGVEVRFASKKGTITDIKIYSDALDADEIERVEKVLKQRPLRDLNEKNETLIYRDIVSLF